MKTAVHQYEDKLLEFAYGELPSHEADAVEAHVRGCPRCTEALSQLGGVRASMSQLPFEAVPDAGLESLLAYASQQAVKNAASRPAPWWRSFFVRPLRPLSSALALVLVGIVAWRATREFNLNPGLVAVQQQADEALGPSQKAREEETRFAPAPFAAEPGAQVPAEAKREAEPSAQEKLAKGSPDDGSAQQKGPSNARRKEQATQGVAAKGDAVSNYSDASRGGATRETPKEPSAPPPTESDKKALAKNELAEGAGVGYGLGGTGRSAPGGGKPLAEPDQRPDSAPAAVAAAPAAAPKPSAPPPAPSKSLALRGLMGSASGPSVADDELARVGDDLAADRDQAFKDRQRASTSRANVEGARAAGQRGDRKAEIQLAVAAIKAGAMGNDRLDMLTRLCDAYEALGQAAAADPWCDAVVSEFPSTGAADLIARRRNLMQRASERPSAEAFPNPGNENSVKKAKAKPVAPVPATR